MIATKVGITYPLVLLFVYKLPSHDFCPQPFSTAIQSLTFSVFPTSTSNFTAFASTSHSLFFCLYIGDTLGIGSSNFTPSLSPYASSRARSPRPCSCVGRKRLHFKTWYTLISSWSSSPLYHFRLSTYVGYTFTSRIIPALDLYVWISASLSLGLCVSLCRLFSKLPFHSCRLRATT